MARKQPKEKTKPVIRTWQYKRAYDCPRNFYFALFFRKIVDEETKKTWRRGDDWETHLMRKSIKGFRSNMLEWEFEEYWLQGHIDGLTIEMIDGKLTIVGHEIKGYECPRRAPFERDLFQSEVYLFLIRKMFPDIPSVMKLHYKNQTFTIYVFDSKRIENIHEIVTHILKNKTVIPKVTIAEVRKKYLCSSGRCDWKSWCKVLDSKYRRKPK